MNIKKNAEYKISYFLRVKWTKFYFNFEVSYSNFNTNITYVIFVI